jgi:death-on-curing protein
MEYLRFEDFILINRLTVERHGGNFTPPKNLLKEESLRYLVEAVEGRIFGQEMYPEIHEKAGFYLFSVNSNHVFQDGNKRTGLEAALLFLRLNGFRLRDDLVRVSFELKEVPSSGETSNQILYNFVIETASGKLSLEECGLWFKANIEVIRK